jgi:hypothetical protein
MRGNSWLTEANQRANEQAIVTTVTEGKEVNRQNPSHLHVDKREEVFMWAEQKKNRLVLAQEMK